MLTGMLDPEQNSGFLDHKYVRDVSSAVYLF